MTESLRFEHGLQIVHVIIIVSVSAWTGLLLKSQDDCASCIDGLVFLAVCFIQGIADGAFSLHWHFLRRFLTGDS